MKILISYSPFTIDKNATLNSNTISQQSLSKLKYLLLNKTFFIYRFYCYYLILREDNNTLLTFRYK